MYIPVSEYRYSSIRAWRSAKNIYRDKIVQSMAFFTNKDGLGYKWEGVHCIQLENAL